MKTSVLCALMVSIGIGLPMLRAAQLGDFTYESSGTEITITGYTGIGGATEIPSAMDGLPVTRIGADAFRDCANLTSITIPDTITSIGRYAFISCGSLAEIRLPSSVTELGQGVFLYCDSLTSISVDPSNAAYSSADGVLYDKVQATLIDYPPGRTGDTIIPEGVRVIGYMAFTYRKGLSSITLPSSLVSIEGFAFSDCTNLTTAEIPGSVVSIGAYAFLRCSSLTEATIPDSVTHIGGGAFSSCAGLTEIRVDQGNAAYVSVNGVVFNKALTQLVQCPSGKRWSYAIPSSVVRIGDSAFSSCRYLESILIPAGVTDIGAWAFVGCHSLVQVKIPNSVTKMGYGVFRDCSNLRTAKLSNDISALEGEAFGFCPNLTSIIIPKRIKTIGETAFRYCTSLAEVKFKGNAPALLGSYVFSGCEQTTVYHLPGTVGWKDTFGGRPTAVWVLPYPVILTTPPNFGTQNSAFSFTVSWATNASVVVEAATDLGNPTWSPVSTNVLVEGVSQFSDPDWADHSGRFYHVRQE